jgi:hypothetical protein
VAINVQVDMGHLIVKFLHFLLQIEYVTFQLPHLLKATHHALGELIIQILILSFESINVCLLFL